MTTFGELRTQILELLDNPTGEGYSDSLLTNAINSAQDAILPWAPKTSLATITGDGVSKQYVLPDDLYDIDAIVVNLTGEVLPRSTLAPGQILGDGRTTNDWIEYPAGSVRFSRVVASGIVYDLYYLAPWTKLPENEDNFTFEFPDFARLGVVLYATAYALLPAAVGVSEIGAWKTKTDSGDPEDNPLQRSVIFIMESFTREMNRHPKYQRAVK